MASSIVIYSEDELADLGIAYLSGVFPTRAIGTKSFLGQLARSEAQLLGAIQQAQKDADDDGCPGIMTDSAGQVQSRCSPIALDNWSFTFGLPSNRGDGVFGRNGATVATGGVALIVGTVGTTVATGALLTDPSTTVTVKLDTGVTIPGGGIAGNFSAVTVGSAGNLPVGTTLRWASPTGLTPTVTLTQALRRGFSSEEDIDLVLRLLRHMQLAPKGGSANDFRTWAEQSTDAVGSPLGISRAYVYPLRNGLGSVDVLVTQAGSGTTRDPGATITAQVLAYLKARKIATDSVRTLRPRIEPAEGLYIKLEISPRAGYLYDWDDSPAGTVLAYSGTSLVLSTATPPPALATAIDNGLRPRIQLSLPTSGPLPVQRRVTAHADNTPMAGQCTLTLDQALTSSPAIGDLVYAGGGAVDLVALAVLGHVDQVGPSRQSGYADPLDQWLDRVSISGLCQTAIDARDVDGSPVIMYLPQVGLGVGATIKIGAAGSYAGDDYLVFDNLPGLAPQLPFVQSILVLKG